VQGDGGGLQETGREGGHSSSTEPGTHGPFDRLGEALVCRGVVHHGASRTCGSLAGLFTSLGILYPDDDKCF